MIRRLFTAASALSFLLFIGTAMLWVRSYWTGDGISWHHLAQRHAHDPDLADDPDLENTDVEHYRNISLFTGRGGILIQREESYWVPGQVNPLFHISSNPQQDVRPTTGMLGFAYKSERGATFISIPIWSAALATAVLPAIWLVRRVRVRMRLAPGCCRRCGYDLRASRDRCPECGTAIPSKAGAAA